MLCRRGHARFGGRPFANDLGEAGLGRAEALKVRLEQAALAEPVAKRPSLGQKITVGGHLRFEGGKRRRHSVELLLGGAKVGEFLTLGLPSVPSLQDRPDLPRPPVTRSTLTALRIALGPGACPIPAVEAVFDFRGQGLSQPLGSDASQGSRRLGQHIGDGSNLIAHPRSFQR